MDDKAIDEARRRGLDVARSTGLFSVVFNGDINQLTSLRAVSEKYPLRGHVMLSDEPFGAPQPAQGIPARGEVWPDSRLAAALGASVGTELNIGARTFRVSRILITRPDQGATFLELAPSLIMNEADLDVHAARSSPAAACGVRSCSPVRALRSPRSRTGSKRTRSRTRKSKTSKTRRRRSSRPSIARRAS